MLFSKCSICRIVLAQILIEFSPARPQMDLPLDEVVKLERPNRSKRGGGGGGGVKRGAGAGAGAGGGRGVRNLNFELEIFL